jgi:hypothetical protein
MLGHRHIHILRTDEDFCLCDATFEQVVLMDLIVDCDDTLLQGSVSHEMILMIIAPSVLEGFLLYREASKRYKLIIIQLSDLFLFIISTSIYFHYLKNFKLPLCVL